MPTYEITAPNGKRYRIAGNGTKEEALAEVQRQYAASEQRAANYAQGSAGAKYLAPPEVKSPRLQQLDQMSFGERVAKDAATIGEGVVGAADAATTLASTAVGGIVGLGAGVAETARQILNGGANDGAAIQAAADQAAQSVLVAPSTEMGQQMVGDVGEVFKAAEPAMNLAQDVSTNLGPLGATAAAVPQGLKAFGGLVRDAAGVPAAAIERRATRVAASAKQGATRVVDAVTPAPEAPAAAPSGFGPKSAGSAELAAGDLRQAKAENLPVPIKLTKGQRTRAFEDIQFERETAKNGDVGDPIRERINDQQAALQQNLDRFIEGSGAEATDLSGVGDRVTGALAGKSKRIKDKIRVLYADARKAGELEAPVTLDAFVEHLEANRNLDKLAPNLPAIRAEAIRLGVAKEVDGKLIAQPTKLGTGEELYQYITKTTGIDKRELAQAKILKGLYNDSTATAGGQKFQAARAEHARLMGDFQGQSLVKNLLGTKRGGTDRAIAAEDVLRRTVLNDGTSAEQLDGVKSLLQRSGPEGRQALKELRGGTLQWIKDQATKGVALNERGEPVVNAGQLDKAIRQLDKNGKLDVLLGKQQAEQLRLLNDVAKDVITVPPGSVNTSNTSSALIQALDLVGSAATGVPAPVATLLRIGIKRSKDAKLKVRIQEHLK